MTEIARPKLAPPRRDWSEFWWRQLAIVGESCQRCGGPLDMHTTVTGQVPDLVISDSLRCLWCGREL